MTPKCKKMPLMHLRLQHGRFLLGGQCALKSSLSEARSTCIQQHKIIGSGNLPPSLTNSRHLRWVENATSTMKKTYTHTTTYEFLLQRLYQVNKFTAVKLGLDNMVQLNAAFGNPSNQYEIIHVAGTNGKGSVSYKIANALEKSGYRTGLFVSPHVSCFRERIQINGQLISEEEVAETLSQIFNMSAQLRIPATFFEITTMLALQHFAKQKVDCVVLETGLGGRLDSTNIVNPTMSVITSIGLDHTRILGNTIAKIAKEKAGIIKPDTPVVIGPHAAPVEIMTEYANKMNAPLSQVPYDSSFSEDFNEENTAIAQTVCAKLNERVLEGKTKLYVDLEVKKIQNALSSRPPCRFQVLHLVRPNSKERKVTIVLDVAHNEPAICRLVNLLKKRFPTQTYRFVCGFSADKDLPKVIQLVQSATPNKDYIHLVKAKHPRGASLEEINTGLDVPFETIASVSDGVEDALATARESQEEEEEQIVVVCGSVFLMSEARQALGFREPVDSAGLNDVAGSYLSTPETRINQKQKR